MNLLYITFGENVSIHYQAAFSIYSFLSKEDKLNSINIITDSPAFYEHLKEHVNVINIDERQLKEWKGPHDFFWRIKIKAIQLLCRRYVGEPVMYLDTDTFLYRKAGELKSILQAGNALMHEDEGTLSKAGSKTEKRMWRQVRDRNFGAITITEAHHMWNAGVVATPNTKEARECQLALDVCDEMCAAGVTRRLVEQFALAVAMQNEYGLKAADTSIAHYWSNKEEWNNQIVSFFTNAYLKNFSLDKALDEFRSFDLSKLPVKKVIKNTAVRLHRVVDELFRVKEEVFIRGAN